MGDLSPPFPSFVGTFPTERYAPVGRCIYCSATESPLTDEHIIPFGLLPKGMDWLLPKASCLSCAQITKKFEGSVQQGMLSPLRHKLGLKTRRKRPSEHIVTFNYRDDGRLEDKVVPLTDFPQICIGFRWPAPGILRGVFPTEIFQGELVVRHDEETLRKFIADGEAFKMGRVFVGDFARLLAKIGHSFAVAKFGLDAFEPFLPRLILGKVGIAPYFIGGDENETPDEYETPLHYLGHLYAITNGIPYLLVSIRLFAKMGMPRYHIVVGRSQRGMASILSECNARKVNFSALP